MTEGNYFSAPLNQSRGGGARYLCWVDATGGGGIDNTSAYAIFSSAANGTGNLSLIRLSDDMVCGRWQTGEGPASESSLISTVQAAALAAGQALSGK